MAGLLDQEIKQPPSKWNLPGQSPNPRSRAVKIILLALPLLCISYLIYAQAACHGKACFPLPDLGTVQKYSASSTENEPLDYPHLNATEFIDTWLNTEVGDGYDDYAITNVCMGKEWRTDIVLDLFGAEGGIGNVRSQILDFIFLAVQIGAPIVLPRYARRSDTDLLDYGFKAAEKNGYNGFEEFFDLDYFYESMEIICPEMTIYSSVEEVPHANVLGGRWDPPRMRSDKDPGNRIEYRMTEFNGWLGAQKEFDHENVNVVKIFRTLWNFDLSKRPMQRRGFGKLLKMRHDIRRLAATAIYNLWTRYELGDAIDPTSLIYPKAFTGVHLRTESDAMREGWLSRFGDFNAQANANIVLATAANVSVIYIASGNQDDIDRFAEMALENHGIHVTSKNDLLEDDDLDELQDLTWDQQALVDYEILSRSSFFTGVVMSSYSWSIAIRRNQYLLHLDSRRRENPHWIQEVDEHATFDDGINRILLRNPARDWMALDFLCPKGMWP